MLLAADNKTQKVRTIPQEIGIGKLQALGHVPSHQAALLNVGDLMKAVHVALADEGGEVGVFEVLGQHVPGKLVCQKLASSLFGEMVEA